MKIVHFHNGSGGGVLSVIQNLLLFRQDETIENHVIYTININKKQKSQFKAPSLTGATSEQIFFFHTEWNFYHTCRQLAMLIPKDALLVAHDWLELGMVSNLGLRNKVIMMVHGNYQYYYELIEKNKNAVDLFLGVSDLIVSSLEQRLNSTERIRRFHFPVPYIPSKCTELNGVKITFIGRCEKAKGYDLLPFIASELQKTHPSLEWHIYGALLDTDVKWPADIRVFHHGVVKHEKLMLKLNEHDYFILPSLSEGLPLTLIESMKAGLIPLVNDLGGGMDELIEHGLNGFIIKDNDSMGYVEAIRFLEANSCKKKRMSKAAIEKMGEQFQAETNTAKFEQYALELDKMADLKRIPEKKYGSRLDEPWIPNTVTKTIRYFVQCTKRLW